MKFIELLLQYSVKFYKNILIKQLSNQLFNPPLICLNWKVIIKLQFLGILHGSKHTTTVLNAGYFTYKYCESYYINTRQKQRSVCKTCVPPS